MIAEQDQEDEDKGFVIESQGVIEMPLRTFIDDSEVIEGYISPICINCAHKLEGHRKCKAFDEKIPLVIWQGYNDHKKPFKGDHGLQYLFKKLMPKMECNKENDKDTIECLLCVAVGQNHLEKVQKLFSTEEDFNAISENGVTELMVEAYNGQTETIKLLINHGADIDAKDNEGRTAIIFAASGWCDTEVIKLLIDKGADIDAKDNEGGTALMFAASGRDDMVLALLNHGANIDAKDKDGRTALMEATNNRMYMAVYVLLDHGADSSLKDNKGDTALRLAIKNGDTISAGMLRSSGATE